MRPLSTLLLAASCLAYAPSAFAISCKDDISTIERRLNSAGAEKVTGETPPSGAATTSNSPKALDKPPSGQPSDPSVKPTAAGVNEARELLKTAKAQDEKGDEKTCQETVSKVKEKAGALP